MNRRFRFLSTCVVVLTACLVTSCTSATPVATSVPPEPTSTPTETPEPTPLPTPTATPRPLLSHLFFSATQDMADTVPSSLAFEAGPASIYASFEYAHVPPGSPCAIRLERDGLTLYESDEIWDGGDSGTAVVPVVTDAHLLTPGEYQLRISLAGQVLSGRFRVNAIRGSDGARLAEDTFDDNLLNWAEYDDDGSVAEVREGRLVVSEAKESYYSWTSLPFTVKDFDVSVDAWQESGPGDGYYGIVFRDDNGRFYVFSVTVDGYFEVGFVTSDAYTPLISRRWSDTIKQGAERNRLRIVAQGPNFAFYINGVRVGSISDKRIPEGAIGLAAGNYDEAGMVSSFDNLEMTLPAEIVEIVPTPVAVAEPRATAAPAATATPEMPPLLAVVQETLRHVHSIGGAMDRIYHEGRPEACAPLLFDFYSVIFAPTYDVSGQPSNVQGAYGLYREAIGIIADKIGKIRDVCEGGGGAIGNLDFDVSRMAINDAGDRLNAALGMLP